MTDKAKPRRKTGPDALGSFPKHSCGGGPKSRRRAGQENSLRYREKSVPVTLKPAPWEKEKSHD